MTIKLLTLIVYNFLTFAAQAAPTILVSIVGAAFYTGCIYVTEPMDGRERPAANTLQERSHAQRILDLVSLIRQNTRGIRVIAPACNNPLHLIDDGLGATALH